MAEFQIKWTFRAIKDLRKVYLFNIELMGEEKSFALVEALFSRVELLADKRFVKAGAPDDQFSHFKRNYKKLIEGNIKITYRLSSDNTYVFINRVFDTRQNPRKNI